MSNTKEISRVIELFSKAGALSLEASTPSRHAKAIAVNEKMLLSVEGTGNGLGFVLYTGLSGSGKSHFAAELCQALLETSVFPVVIDLDRWSSEIDGKWVTDISSVTDYALGFALTFEVDSKHSSFIYVMYGTSNNMVELFGDGNPFANGRLSDVTYLIAPHQVYQAANWFKLCSSFTMGVDRPLAWKQGWLESSSLSAADYLVRVSHSFEMLTRVFKRVNLEVDPMFTINFESEVRGWHF